MELAQPLGIGIEVGGEKLADITVSREDVSDGGCRFRDFGQGRLSACDFLKNARTIFILKRDPIAFDLLVGARIGCCVGDLRLEHLAALGSRSLEDIANDAEDKVESGHSLLAVDQLKCAIVSLARNYTSEEVLRSG